MKTQIETFQQAGVVNGCAGACIDTDTTQCWGSLVYNECPGGNNIVCCVGAVSSCPGTCINVDYQACSGTLHTNECPGPADIQCCTSGPPPQYLSGIDVSSYQGTIDFNSLRAAGLSFVMSKATEGLTYSDPTFAYNFAGTASIGLVRGAYHFAHPSEDPYGILIH
jgi:hypothetical protein